MEINSLAQIINDIAKRHPERTAVKIADETITYQEMLVKSSQIANTLNKLGAIKEAIGIIGQRHMASYVGIVGTLLSGCYYVPINPKHSKGKITSIIDDSKIRFFIGDIDSFLDINLFSDQKEFNYTATKIIPFEEAPQQNDWIDKDHIKQSKSDIDLSGIQENDLVYTIYTSGSTGRPKGVQITNLNVISLIENMSLLHQFEPGFNASQMADLSFDFSVSELFHTWASGGVLCVIPEKERLNPSDFIIRESIEVWSTVPSLLNFMSRIRGLKKDSFPSIKFSFFCGEPLPFNLAKEWSLAAPNSCVENFYGPTEATVWFTVYKYDLSEENIGRNCILPIGTPFPKHEVEIISKDGIKLEKGHVGELVYKGPQLTNGYLNDLEKTESVFVQFNWDKSSDTWYKSGDLGFYNSSGYLECVGRKDSQIKIGGRRVEIGEIEAALSKFKALKDVIVVPIKDQDRVVTGCVAFTMNKISKDERANIQNASGQYLERIFFPKKIITINEYPYLSSGKIDRKALERISQT